MSVSEEAEYDQTAAHARDLIGEAVAALRATLTGVPLDISAPPLAAHLASLERDDMENVLCHVLTTHAGLLLTLEGAG